MDALKKYLPLLHLRKDVDIVRASGLFWAQYYADQVGISKNKTDLIRHFLKGGWQLHRPNPFFDPSYYIQQYDDVRASGRNPLVHYITHGEEEGRYPCEFFAPSWYRRMHPTWHSTNATHKTALLHYIERPDRRLSAPNAVFDPVYYEASNSDVSAAGIEPSIHFYLFGWKEGRKPARDFDMAFYRRNYMQGVGDHINPATYHLHVGIAQENTTERKSETGGDLFRDVAKFVTASPLHETADLTEVGPLSTKALAFYLPQFHRFQENDDWWGKGFTEWTNVAKGVPRFKGHYQPRITADLGFYDLTDPRKIREQVTLARASGIHGFCFYYYAFNSKRLMQRPLDVFMEEDLEFPFCILWANENWTRRWDGLENEVLISQDYLLENDEGLIQDFVRYFRNPRYITVGGRPLFVIYRPSLIPDTALTIARWRSMMQDQGFDPLIMMVQGFGFDDPIEFSCDGAIEFAPHKVAAGLSPVAVEKFDPSFSGAVIQYDEVCVQSLTAQVPDYPLMRGVMPSWDNDVRRQGKGSTIYHGSTPAKYQHWLAAIAQQSTINPVLGESIVFINAWNEWAEGAYLEPDVHYGSAYLNATKRALMQSNQRIAVIVHSFYPDVLMQILEHLKNCPMQFELFITCDSSKLETNKKTVATAGMRAVFVVCPNKGRDILPFLTVLQKIRNESYTHVLKLHTKKSLHRADGDDWRLRMLDGLISPTACFNALAALSDNSGVGIVGPESMVVSLREYWGSNRDHVLRLCEQLNITITELDSYCFVAGTMFYARMDALIPTLDLGLVDEAFELEDGQVDGTLAHAVERIISVAAMSSGKRIVELRRDPTQGWDIFEYQPSEASRFEYAEKTIADDL